MASAAAAAGEEEEIGRGTTFGSLTFKQSYICYGFSWIEKMHLEEGDKIIMPPSALERLTALSVDFPILFEIRNTNTGRVSHCGVLEFTADPEDVVFMPEWMMQNLQLEWGDQVVLKPVTLRKGTYMKIQPHTKDFIQLSNPKAVLERKLRDFSCLSIGDTIIVSHNNKKFYIDVVKTKPSPAICIINTDIEVDFATTLDYKEPEKQVLMNTATSKHASTEANKEEPKFRPFTGLAKRLDIGRASASEFAAAGSWSPMLEDSPMFATISKDNQSNLGSRRKSGKLVFGFNMIQNPKETTVDIVDETLKKGEQKFQPFSGKKHTFG
ncbi:hypothetical protein F0562_005411 [Nyssa sinensis]|uniref:Uncharacterized protein n=1 Tax=Nyssa sinensis TaxID=561372 RepID=A0A5J5AHW0_9ASTE|nr:hypothetical protein F0562_005411 [Nyssa sinensis]